MFYLADLEKMSSLERISFLQEKLQDIRNHYLSLKSEVASIDRRRKRIKKKERESKSVLFLSTDYQDWFAPAALKSSVCKSAGYFQTSEFTNSGCTIKGQYFGKPFKICHIRF